VVVPVALGQHDLSGWWRDLYLGPRGRHEDALWITTVYQDDRCLGKVQIFLFFVLLPLLDTIHTIIAYHIRSLLTTTQLMTVMTNLYISFYFFCMSYLKYVLVPKHKLQDVSLGRLR